MTIQDDERRFRRFALSRTILLGWAIFLSVVAAVPCRAIAQAGEDESAVYKAVLTRFIGPETSRIVLSDSTRRVRRVGRIALEMLSAAGADVPNEVLEDFNRRNSAAIPFPESLVLPVPVELLSDVDLLALREGDDIDEWDWLRRRLPGSPGVVSLSRPGFSPAGDRALIHVTLMCGARCGEGSWVLLRRSGDEWEIEHWITTLRS